MANTFQQKAQVRKLVYAALILTLFTVSLIHRILPRYGLDAQAFHLQLREASRGEVNLTSSAVRQMLIGSRAIAVSLLWHAAINAQDKQNWSEVQLLVDSITTLQPYFISPWRYQGWNLAFNVSVQCDRPSDRYYYIAHGLSLLAEGERRNQGAEIEGGKTRFPGNPDLRRDIGFFYQMKMGISDDKYTMRSLLELSCIDPVERNFEGLSEQERRDKLRTFCHNYPTLVRRLVEHVHCDDSLREGYKIFKFLKQNKDVPSRFEPPEEGQKASILKKNPSEQFPILPRHEADWPDPNNPFLTNEPINPYVMARTWYLYAQKPLPPPRNFFDSSRDEFPKDLDRSQYSEPSMNQYFFRTDPCRAQEFLAETFEQEGWYDGEGWDATKYLRLEQEDASRAGAGKNVRAVVVGTEPRYQVQRVWSQAASMFLETGRTCGLYFDDALRRKFESQAAKYREKHYVKYDQAAPELKNKNDAEDAANRFAHEALRLQRGTHGTTNFDGHMHTCQAKGTPEAVLASKYFYNAQRSAKATSPARAIEQYELAQPIWLYVLLQNPRFARVASTQEDTYQSQLYYCSLVQGAKYRTFQDILLGMTELVPNWTCVPPPWSSVPAPDPWQAEFSIAMLELFMPVPWSSTQPGRKIVGHDDLPRLFAARPAWSFLSQADRLKVLGPQRDSKLRTTRGLFDMTQYYDGPPGAPEKYTAKLKETLVALSYGASVSPRVPFPYEPALMLTRAPLGEQPPPRNWRNLIDGTSIAVVRARLQITPPKN